MRIAGYIPHPQLKITIFQLDNKFAIKLEDTLLEQTYKFRRGPNLDSPADVRRLVDDRFLAGVLAQMDAMHQMRQAALQTLEHGDEEEFEDII